MASLSFDVEVVVEAPPAAMLEGFVKFHELAGEIWPGLKSGRIIEGDGGPGSINQMELVEGGYVRERIELVDKDALEAKITTIEGPLIGTMLQSIIYHCNFAPAPDGVAGSVCKGHVECPPLPGADFTDADLDVLKLKVAKMFQAIATHISAKA